MRLRVFTAALMAFGIAWLLSWTWIIGPRPPHGAPREALRAHASRASVYLGVLVLTLITSGVCAALIVRQAKREYREFATQNLKDLVEGSLRDHKKPDEGEGD